MVVSAAKRKETFIVRPFRLLGRNAVQAFKRANDWREDAVDWMQDSLEDVREWQLEYWWPSTFWLGVVIWLGLLIWFIVDWAGGRVDGSGAQTGVGAIIGGGVLSLIASPLIALVLLVGLLLFNYVFMLIAPILAFIPLIIWFPIYAVIQLIIVFVQLLMLIPLAILFVFTRLFQLCRGIFFTCPSRQCSYRGLPAYDCDKCGTANYELWPNLYGVLTQECVGCGKRLPTLGFRGRNKLARRCGDPKCGIPFLGKHAGLVPERLVAIVGGPNSGKTNYLLMAVHQVLNGGDSRSRVNGEIDDDSQKTRFDTDWEGLSKGRPAEKTTVVTHAFLMYMAAGLRKWWQLFGNHCQLYLYDAPGGEFQKISGMKMKQYFPLIEGFILLVDPDSYPFLQTQKGKKIKATDFQSIVDSTVGEALSVMLPGADGRLSKKVAVVISKADLDSVKDYIGDISKGPIDGKTCRKAVESWGGGNAIRTIENRFREVEYFACSPLGREDDRSNRTAFQGHGVLDPLVWMLTGQRQTVVVPSPAGRTQMATREVTSKTVEI